MLIGDFFKWFATAPQSARARAAEILAQIWLTKNFGPLSKSDVEAALTALATDHAAATRLALARAFAGMPDIPHHILVPLLCDRDEIASLLAAHTLPLADSEIAELAPHLGPATCDLLAQNPQLGTDSMSALAAHAPFSACLRLANAQTGKLPEAALESLIWRFGDITQLRLSLLATQRISASLRLLMVERLCHKFLTQHGPTHLRPAATVETELAELHEKAAVSLLADLDEAETGNLIVRLHDAGRLTTSLLLRAAIMCKPAAIEVALTLLGGHRRTYIAATLRNGRLAVLQALFFSAGIPPVAHDLFYQIIALRRPAWSEPAPRLAPAQLRELTQALVGRFTRAREQGNAGLRRLVRSLDAEIALLQADRVRTAAACA